jgi:TolB-like protein
MSVDAIVLARETTVRLGPLTIEPALLRVTHDDGQEAFLQPRVMQVLVALARAHGKILSRDDLMAQCWNGVIVGEDAINRVMVRLRQLLEGLGAGVFRVETITKVGYRLITEGSAAPPVAIKAIAAQAEPRLAVLAFDNLSGDKDLTYFSDGVSAEILDTVVRGSALRVIAPSSSFQFRGPDKVVRRVAADLQATHLLDGSVRRSGGRVRISARLIECASETAVWSDRFDRELSDVFALQDEIAEAVAAALRTAFAPRKAAAPIDPAVHDLFLRASQYHFDPDKSASAVRMLEEVTRKAPGFADGWANLAAERARRELFLPYAERPASSELVNAAADRALALDPDSPAALTAKLMILPPFGAYTESEPLVERLRPTSWAALEGLNRRHVAVGRIRAALDNARQVCKLDPLPSMPQHFLGFCSWMAGQVDAAVECFHAALARDPDNHYASNDLVLIAAWRGDWATVDALLDPERLKRHPLREFNRMAHRIVELLRNHLPDERGRLLVDGLRRRMARASSVDFFALAFAGEFAPLDEVYEIAEKALFGPTGDARDEMGIAYRPTFCFHAWYSRLRSDPRFVRLCARLGLVEYWLATEKWPDCADEVPYDLKAECAAIADLPLKQPFRAALEAQNRTS